MPALKNAGIVVLAYIKGEAVTQGSLFPVSLDELIPADHSVRVIAAYVRNSLALDALGFSKAVAKATGRPPSCRYAEVVCVWLSAPRAFIAPTGS